MLFRAPEARIPVKDLPQCHCGGLLRPRVVWFGESLDPLVIQQAGMLFRAPDPEAWETRIPVKNLPQYHCGGLLMPHVV